MTSVVRSTPEEALQLAFANVGREFRARLTRDGDPAAVTLLQTLELHGPLRSSAIAEVLRLDASTVSRQVNALETASLVARSQDRDDRRAALVSLTPKGRQWLGECLARRCALIRAATRNWPADDRRSLARLLERFADDLSRVPASQEIT
jgi:DNA-binding MarR family transcriptional regulator